MKSAEEIYKATLEASIKVSELSPERKKQLLDEMKNEVVREATGFHRVADPQGCLVPCPVCETLLENTPLAQEQHFQDGGVRKEHQQILETKFKAQVRRAKFAARDPLARLRRQIENQGWESYDALASGDFTEKGK